MPTYTNAYSGFSTNDIAAAERFYTETLGLDVTEENGMLTLSLPGGARVLVYPKDDHQPAAYTCLNLEVTDIGAAVDELAGRGVTFARYDGMPHDERGIVREWGPPIAWFTDPAGNIVSIIEASGS
jgi:catechol 2,3-dioxygenase-like lactoylglutathione lyase family enzyme